MGLEEEYANPHLKWVHHGAVQGNAQAIRDWVKWYWSDPDTLHETPDGRLTFKVRQGIRDSVYSGHLDVHDGGNDISSIRISCFPLADAALPTMEKLGEELLAVFPPVTEYEVEDPHPHTGRPLSDEQLALADKLPKKKTTFERYAAIWASICEMQDQYSDDFVAWDTNEPQPTNDDIRDRLRAEGHKAGTRTIQNIKMLGSVGLLDTY